MLARSVVTYGEGMTVATVGDVVARLRAVRTSCDTAIAALRDADQAFQSSIETLTQALTGAGDDVSIGLLELVPAALHAASDAVRNAAGGVQQHVSRLSADGTAGGTAATPASSAPPPAAPASRWIDADGHEHAEVSGKDEKYNQAIQLFKDMKARRIPIRASDVEMKLAAHMRENGIRSATLVVNNVPCEGPLGCDALLPVILPNGYTLTVYGPDGFVREYQGGETSSWLP